MCFVITIWQHFANKKNVDLVLLGGPGRVIRIVNTHYTQGISLHGFPSDKKDRKRRRQRNRFVIKALTKFRAICAFVLTCSSHFEETKNLGISAAVGLTRKLVADAIPLIDAVLGCYNPGKKRCDTGNMSTAAFPPSQCW